MTRNGELPILSAGLLTVPASPVDITMTPTDIERALGGDRQAKNALVAYLEPVIQIEVGRALRPAARLDGRNWRQEMLDLVQDVFVVLFADDLKVLRSWDPQRGLSLRGFVGLVGFRHVLSALKTKRRNPYAAMLVASDVLDAQRPLAGDLAGEVANREELDLVLREIRAQFSERDLVLFRILYLEGGDTEDACAITGMRRGAVYAWRGRLKKRVEKIRARNEKRRAG